MLQSDTALPREASAAATFTDPVTQNKRAFSQCLIRLERNEDFESSLVIEERNNKESSVKFRVEGGWKLVMEVNIHLSVFRIFQDSKELLFFIPDSYLYSWSAIFDLKNFMVRMILEAKRREKAENLADFEAEIKGVFEVQPQKLPSSTLTEAFGVAIKLKQDKKVYVCLLGHFSLSLPNCEGTTIPFMDNCVLVAEKENSQCSWLKVLNKDSNAVYKKKIDRDLFFDVDFERNKISWTEEEKDLKLMSFLVVRGNVQEVERVLEKIISESVIVQKVGAEKEKDKTDLKSEADSSRQSLFGDQSSTKNSNKKQTENPSKASFSGQSVFGSKPSAPTTFGSIPPVPTTFGPNPFTPTTFGSTPLGASTFGSKPSVPSTFGSIPPASSTFGSNPSAQSTFGSNSVKLNPFGSSPKESKFFIPSPKIPIIKPESSSTTKPKEDFKTPFDCPSDSPNLIFIDEETNSSSNASTSKNRIFSIPNIIESNSVKYNEYLLKNQKIAEFDEADSSPRVENEEKESSFEKCKTSQKIESASSNCFDESEQQKTAITQIEKEAPEPIIPGEKVDLPPSEEKEESDTKVEKLQAREEKKEDIPRDSDLSNFIDSEPNQEEVDQEFTNLVLGSQIVPHNGIRNSKVFVQNSLAEKYRNMVQAKTLGLCLANQGEGIEIFKFDRENEVLGLKHSQSLRRIDSLRGEPIVASKIQLQEGDTRMVMMNERNPNYLSYTDLTKGKVISEWCPTNFEIKDISLSSGKQQSFSSSQLFLAVSGQNIVRMDPRTKCGVVSEHDYATNYRFDKILSVFDNEVVVASQNGDLRYYGNIERNAKNVVPAPIYGRPMMLDHSSNGLLILITYPQAVILMPTEVNGISAFSKMFLKCNKPGHVVLTISSIAMERHGIKNLNYISAKFDEKENDHESFVVAVTNEFMILWKFSEVKNGKLTTSLVRKMNERVVAGEFMYNHDDIVATFQRNLEIQDLPTDSIK